MASASASTLFIRPDSACNRIVRLTIWGVVAGILSLAACGWWSYPVSAWLALILIAAYYFFLLKVAPAAGLALFPALGGVALTQFISGILIESGGYLSETKEMGSPTGGFLRLAVLYVLFFGTAAVIIEAYIGRWRQCGQIAKFVAHDVHPFMALARLLNAAIFVGLGYLIYIGIMHGFPLLTGMDRFDFSQQLADPIYSSVMGNRIVAMPYVGMMLAIGGRPKFYRSMALCVLVVSALLGDKFTEFVVIFGQLAAPSLCRLAWGERGLPLRKFLLLGLAVVCVTMPLVFIVYGGLSDSSEGFERMKDRMTLQGQLWFLADREVSDVVKFEEEPIFAEGNMMIAADSTPLAARNRSNGYQGMAWMMLHFAPPSDAYLRMNTGVVYTMGLHAYFLEILGWAGVVAANFLFAVLVGLISAGMMYSLVYGRLVYLLFFSKFMTFWISASSVADPFILINWKNFLFLMCLGLYAVLDRRFSPIFQPQTVA